MLSDGQTLALISDAGTPGVSDPGAMLVGEVRSRAPNVKIITVPGASAVTSAYSVSGLYGNNFLFLGFAPQKKGRETFFKQVANSEYNVVFYESVHRFEKCLENIKVALSNSSNETLTVVDDNKYNNTDKTQNSNQALNRRIIIARELTKIYEEVISGNIDEVISYYSINNYNIL
jgi:16S rRNA (cytidine1402-2'-O)-methyltransferase